MYGKTVCTVLVIIKGLLVLHMRYGTNEPNFEILEERAQQASSVCMKLGSWEVKLKIKHPHHSALIPKAVWPSG